jgi:UDP:flavonoid glycosyltransferase YjiC (YdhE family)
LPRTAVGRAVWRRAQRPVAAGLELGRRELNHARARLGLPALGHVHGGISRELALVATFPQLEYPRRWPEHVRVVGPLMWEPLVEQGAAAERWLGEGERSAAGGNGRGPQPPGGDELPVVLIAPSTAQDREHRLLRTALGGLADAPMRVLATYNRRLPRAPLSVPHNATVVEWVVYSRTMPRCDVVVCHGGHGTLVRALASGCPVVACPAVGDMNENAARLDWSGAGVRVPRRFVSPRVLRVAVERVLADGSMRDRAGELATWAGARNAGAEAARLVEGLAERRRGGKSSGDSGAARASSKELRGWDSNPQPLG